MPTGLAKPWVFRYLAAMPVQFARIVIFAGVLFAIAGWPNRGYSHVSYELAVRPTDVRPTQAVVGYLWVDKKLNKFINMSEKELDKDLRQTPPAAVLGPGGLIYLLDNHHEFYALIELQVKKAYVTIVADLSALGKKQFEQRMIDKRWVYFGDEFGRLSHSFATLPQSIASLRDDPYRSLASYLRRAGGFKKTGEYYMEFKWANALRRVIPLRLIQTDLADAVDMAMDFARSSDAKGLPGYKGKTGRSACERRLK